jgi:hypothetical protein
LFPSTWPKCTARYAAPVTGQLWHRAVASAMDHRTETVVTLKGPDEAYGMQKPHWKVRRLRSALLRQSEFVPKWEEYPHTRQFS